MSWPSPTTAALDRIRSLGETAFLGFLDEVSPNATLALADSLPPVSGFRKASKSGIQQRKRELWRRLLRLTPTNKERVEFALYKFWHAWAMEHLGDPAGTSALFDAIEQAASGEEEANAGLAILELFAALKTRSLANACSREKIERLFSYSPFDETPEIRASIDGAKSAADIERESAITELPQRLSRDEKEIKSIEENLGLLLERMDSSSAEIRDIQKELAATTSEAARAASANKEIRAHIEAHAEALQSSANTLAAQGKDLAAHSKATDERLARISAQLDALSRKVESERADRAREEWTAATAHRLDALEAREASPGQSPPAGQDPPPARDALPASIRAHALRAGAGPADRSFATFADATIALAANLEAIGLKKSAAQALAEEICAAAFVGQVVFLKGGRATGAVRLCAQTLGGQNSFRMAIPIGLNDGEALTAAVRHELSGAGDNIAAVAIEGANRSGLDVFADALSDMVAGDRDFSGRTQRPTLVFAGVTQGAASLAIEPRYLELGPIFDLDHLDWRLRLPVSAELVIGAFSIPVFRSIRDSLVAKPADSEEPLRLLRRFTASRNPRMESVVVAAHAALASIERRQKLPTPLQSIAFGWLVPLWATLGLTREEVDSELDGGKCDSGAADPRLTSLLTAGEFAPGKVGAS
jgi:hypothetical protein